ncbi:DUF4231 domain-containing protein [Streptomyces cacaoi]|uniref:DUF4231 domain-containing protein n=1 Tax=Streptomyces cacaoi TaxID=1898 RepID=UPI003331C2FF
MPGLSDAEINDLQRRYREKALSHEIAADSLRRQKSLQRIFWSVMAAAMTLTAFLGYTIVASLWQEAAFMRWISFVLVVALWLGASWKLLTNRTVIIERANTARNTLFDKQTAASALPLESEAALRIYRESTYEVIDAYRARAARNRRVNNLFQTLIIVGSVAVTSLSALNTDTSPLSIIAVTLSALVSAAAGLTAYFKFRERSFNLQSTADEIEKHSMAAQYAFDDYEGVGEGLPPEQAEKARLRKFVKFVEKIKEEQRKRELQLEQSPEAREDRS